MVLSAIQYQVMLSLFNECNDAFWALPHEWKDAFFKKLYAK